MPADVTLDIEADDNASDDVARLRRNVQQLGDEVKSTNQEIVRSVRTTTDLTTNQTRLISDQIRSLDRQRDRASREQIARTNAEGRIAVIQERARLEAERDLRRAKERRIDEERRETARLEREQRRARQAEIRHERQLQALARQRRASQIGGIGGALGTGNLTGLISQLSAANVAFGGFAIAATAAGRAVVSAASDFDRLNRGLTAITGSASAAQAQLESIEQLARLPGISFQDASRTALRLRASGFDEERTNRLIREFGNAAQVSGASFQDAAESLRQLTQIQSTGRFTAENFNIILERLPILRQVALEAFGTTVGGDIQTALEARGQDFDDAVGQLLDGLQRIQRVDADSFQNAASNLGNDLNRLAREIGEGLLPIARDLTNQMASLVRFFTGTTGQALLSTAAGVGLARGAQALVGLGGGLIRRGGGAAVTDIATGTAAGGLFTRGNAALATGIGGVGALANLAEGLAITAGLNRLRRQGRFPDAASFREARVAFTEGLFTGELAQNIQNLDAIEEARNRSGVAAGRFRSGLQFQRARISSIGGRVPLLAAGVGSLAGPAGLAIGGAIGLGYFAGARDVERQAEAIRENTRALDRVSSAFNQQVFGGPEGLGRARQFEASLQTLQRTLTPIVEPLAGFPTGRFEPTRGIIRGVPRVADLLRNLNLDRISPEEARTLITQITDVRARNQAILDAQNERRRELNQQIEGFTATIGFRRRQIRETQPRRTGRGGEEVFPNLPGVENIEDYRQELQRLVTEEEKARTAARETLQQLENRIPRQEEYNRLLSENSDILQQLGDIANREANRLARIQDIIAGYSTELTRAQTQLGNVLFSLERANTVEEVNAALQRQILAIRRVSDAESDIATTSIQDAEQRAAALEAINARAQQARIRAEEAAAAQITLINERLAAQGRAIFEAQIRAYNDYQELTKQAAQAIETVNSGIQDTIDSVTSLGRAIGSAFQGAIDRIGGAGEALNRFNGQILRHRQELDALRAAENLAGVRAGLRRDPREAEAFRDAYSVLFQGRRITEAVRGIGVTGVRTPFDADALPRTERAPDLRNAQRRQQVQSFLEQVGNQAYTQFGGDLLLDALGIGGRRQTALRNALEDLRGNFRDVANEIRRDSTISERERLDELLRLNQDYLAERRGLERQAEQERARAWQDFVRTVLADFGRILYQQAQLRIAERATNFAFDRIPFLRGGGAAAAGRGVAQYASPIGPGLAGTGTAGTGIGLGTAATAGVTLAGIAVAANGLVDPIRDLFNSFSFHNASNDQYAFDVAARAGREIFGGQTPSQFGQQSARDLVDQVVSGIQAGAAQGGGQQLEAQIQVDLNLNDRSLQTVVERTQVMARQGRS